jgi:hypothetical protein
VVATPRTRAHRRGRSGCRSRPGRPARRRPGLARVGADDRECGRREKVASLAQRWATRRTVSVVGLPRTRRWRRRCRARRLGVAGSLGVSSAGESIRPPASGGSRTLLHVDDERPVGEPSRMAGSIRTARAPQRGEAQVAQARQPPDLARPGAGGVDDHAPRTPGRGRTRQPPGVRSRPVDPRAGDELGPARRARRRKPCSTASTSMSAVVSLSAPRQSISGRRIGQSRGSRRRRPAAGARRSRSDRARAPACPAGDLQLAAGPHQRVVGEPLGRRPEEAARGRVTAHTVGWP